MPSFFAITHDLAARNRRIKQIDKITDSSEIRHCTGHSILNGYSSFYE